MSATGRVSREAERDARETKRYVGWAGVATEFNVAIRQAEEANRKRK